MMPVGIQMFATITSKDHVRHIQQDLQNMYFSDMYRDTVLHCSDGSIYLSRLLTGLLFPFLKPSRCFQLLEEATLILPEYNKLEIEKSIFNLLGIKYSDQSQESANPNEWPRDIDRIIGTLHPASPVKGYKNRAVLHSAVTHETAVIHAASTDDERDDLRIVDGGDLETEKSPEDWKAVPVQDDNRKVHKKFKVLHHQSHKRKAEALESPVSQPPPPAVVENHQQSAPSPAGDVGPPHHPHHQPPPTHHPPPPHHQPPAHHQPPHHIEAPHYIVPDLVPPVGETSVVLPAPQLLCCTLCNSLFEDQKQFEIHIKQSHNMYKCNKCEATFKKQRDLLDHGRVHSGHKLIKCHICDKDFTERGLLWHTERFHKLGTLDSTKPMKKRGVKLDVSVEAEVKPKSEDDPQLQVETAQSPTTPSDEKDKEEVYPKNNVYFSSSDSEPDDPAAESEATSDRSKRRKTRSRDEDHCDQCGATGSRRSMAEHRKSCQGVRPDPAPAENGAGAGAGTSKDGSGSSSGGSGKKTTLRKLFSCSYCYKKFSYNSSMRVHEKVHLGGKPYHCDMCSARFSNKFDLYAHEKEHSDQRPHKCDMCQETFKTEENLRFHKMIHSASEPITCKYCNKYFQTKAQLTDHEKIHTGPFKCGHCGISYDKISKLTTHTKSKHPKEQAAGKNS